MKIVIDARKISHSTGRYTLNLLRQLERLDPSNQYTVLVKPDEVKTWQPTQPNWHLKTASAPEYTFREQFALAWQLYRGGADLVHFTMPQHPLLYVKPFVVTIHDLTQLQFPNRAPGSLLKRFYKNRLKPLALRLTLWHGVRFSRQIIVPSNYVKRQLLERYQIKEAKITVTYEAAEPPSSASEPIVRLASKTFLLYVGNAYPYKNLDCLLTAFQRLQPQHPKLLLVLAGKIDSHYQALQQRAARFGLKNIIFAGYVADSELTWLYQQARALVFPSLSEGFGLPGLEAMAHNLPVLAARSGPLPEVYGEGALYFDPKRPDQLAAAIERLLSDQRLSRQLVQTGQQVVKRYSWRRMAQQTLQVYQRAVGQEEL